VRVADLWIFVIVAKHGIVARECGPTSPDQDEKAAQQKSRTHARTLKVLHGNSSFRGAFGDIASHAPFGAFAGWTRTRRIARDAEKTLFRFRCGIDWTVAGALGDDAGVETTDNGDAH